MLLFLVFVDANICFFLDNPVFLPLFPIFAG